MSSYQAYTLTDTRQIIQGIDTIIRELDALRQLLTVPTPAKSEPVAMSSLTEELFGAAGQGTWDECDPYLDVARFANEHID